MSITTTPAPPGAPDVTDGPDRVALVATLRFLADLVESRPDLDLSRYATMSLRVSVDTLDALNVWADTFGATVRYQSHDNGTVIPHIEHKATPTMRLYAQSPAIPDPRPDPRDAEILRLRAALAATTNRPGAEVTA